MTTTYSKLQKACEVLNREAYTNQAAKHKVKQFTPCAKADILIKACRYDTNFIEALQAANMTQCNCHNSLSESQLYDMCF